ncbi:MAG: hypothetical protein QOD77_663 [Thermoplasmata archaeon]|jgi:hypothetical protein|nr:hypothetical protein [Thermoplasmata archaeon]
MGPPPYSTASAASELLVTAAVLYVVARAYRRGDFRRALIAIVLAFEVFANVLYMAYRMAVPTPPLAQAAGWLGGVAALHGILSLAMLLFLGILVALAWRDGERGTNTFRELKGTTWTFVGLWLVSVASGEFLYAALYLA